MADIDPNSLPPVPGVKSDTAQTEPTGLLPTGDLSQIVAMLADMKTELARERAARAVTEKQLEALTREREELHPASGLAVFRRHCNACGTDVEEGKRCARHPGEKVNHLGRLPVHDSDGRQVSTKTVIVRTS